MFLRNVSIQSQNYKVSKPENHDRKLQNVCTEEQCRHVQPLLLFHYLENCRNKKKSRHIKLIFHFLRENLFEISYYDQKLFNFAMIIAETQAGPRWMCPLLLSDFNRNGNVENCSKISSIKCQKVPSAILQLFHPDRRTDRKANMTKLTGSFSQLRAAHTKFRTWVRKQIAISHIHWLANNSVPNFRNLREENSGANAGHYIYYREYYREFCDSEYSQAICRVTAGCEGHTKSSQSMCNQGTNSTCNLLDKPIVPRLVMNFPAFYWKWRCIFVFTKARHLPLSWSKLIQSTSYRPDPLIPIIMLSSHLHLRLPSRFSLSSFHIKHTYAFSPSSAS
jgi:hypothetical protein